MEASGIHHLGVAVENLDQALVTYAKLFGAELQGRMTLPGQGVEAAAVRVGQSRLELLAPLGEETPVGKFLAKRGPGMHHVAYEVPDIRAALVQLEQAGAELVDREPREGLYGVETAFVHPSSVYGVLSEVIASG